MIDSGTSNGGNDCVVMEVEGVDGGGDGGGGGEMMVVVMKVEGR